MEIADYATYDGAIVMFDVMGFGKPLDEVPMLFQPGVLGIAWGCGIRQLAAGLNISLDSITESYEREPAPPEAFDVAAGHIAKGGSPRCASRSKAWWATTRPSSSSMSPGCARICGRTGRSLRSPAGPTGWRSPASVLHRRHLPDQHERRSQLRRDRRRRGPHRQRHPPRGDRRPPPGIRTTLNLPLVSEVELFAKP